MITYWIKMICRNRFTIKYVNFTKDKEEITKNK